MTKRKLIPTLLPTQPLAHLPGHLLPFSRPRVPNQNSGFLRFSPKDLYSGQGIRDVSKRAFLRRIDIEVEYTKTILKNSSGSFMVNRKFHKGIEGSQKDVQDMWWFPDTASEIPGYEHRNTDAFVTPMSLPNELDCVTPNAPLLLLD